jgi:hypothetical protein
MTKLFRILFPTKWKDQIFLILSLKLCTIEFWIVTTQWGKKKEIWSFYFMVLTFPNTFHQLTKVQKWVFEEHSWAHYTAYCDTQPQWPLVQPLKKNLNFTTYSSNMPKHFLPMDQSVKLSV